MALALGLVVALLAGACGGDDDDDGSGANDTNADTEVTEAPAASEDLGNGVSADAVKVAFAIVDFQCIKDFVSEIRVDQDEAYQVFVDHVNNNGGINGRKIEPLYHTYCPIPGAEPSGLSICTSAAEDQDVFAIVGVFVDFSGDAQLCVTREHERVLIAYELTQEWMDQAPPGLMLSPGVTAERRISILMSLLKEEGTLDGKKVVALAEDTTESRIADAIEPALADMDVERGTDAVLAITGTDTAAAQAQLDSFIERWKSEGVDAVILTGLAISNKQFIEKIKAAMPDVQLLADNTSWLGSARDLVEAGTEPNPYDGILTAEGETGEEHAKGPEAKECDKIWKDATGKDVPPPGEFPDVSEDGQRIDTRYTVHDPCTYVLMFATIAEKAGANLNNDNWVKAVNDFGKIRIMSTKYASLREGKYDVDDTFRIAAFDPTIGDTGDFRPVTPVRDVEAEEEDS
jgi:hypothetical protein